MHSRFYFSNLTRRHVVLGESRQPTTVRSKAWRSLSGAGGKTINFTIHYRSRGMLKRNTSRESLLICFHRCPAKA
jgi:hypothetical protein